MGSVLPLLGIAAIMMLGFVVLLVALTHASKIGQPPAPAAAREHGRQGEHWRKQAQHTLSAVRELAVALRTRAIALAVEWWPRLRHHARNVRGLTFDSTVGQLIAAAAISVIVACLIVTLG